VVSLGPHQSEVGEFGGTIQAEGQAHSPDAAIYIELHVVEVEHPFDVLLAHRWKDEWANDWEPNLTTMGMTGEHQVDQWESGVEDDVFDVVGLMAHEDDGCTRVWWDRKV